MLSACLASASWISSLPDGLKLQVEPDVHVVQGEWTILITIDEPQPPPELLRMVQRIRRAILSLRGDAATYLSPYQPDWHIRLQTIESECRTPHRWWRRQQQSRTRRGLINAVGLTMNYLFGTATADQVNGLRETVQELVDSQQRILTRFDQFTSILNHTYDEIQMNREQIALLNGKLSKLAIAVHTDLSVILQNVKLLTTRVDFETIISQLEDVSHTYVRSHEGWLHRRENLELGRLTENLLPTEVLREPLLSAEEEQAFIIDPIEWYYEHVYIVPMWLDNSLIYRTRIPVVSGEAWHYVKLQQWLPLYKTLR